MASIIGIIAFFFVLVWAFRLEIGIAKANEALKRIEDKLTEDSRTIKKEKK